MTSLRWQSKRPQSPPPAWNNETASYLGTKRAVGELRSPLKKLEQQWMKKPENNCTKMGRRKFHFPHITPSPRPALLGARRNSPMGQSSLCKEKASEVNTSFPSHSEDLLQFYSAQRPAKLTCSERARNKEKGRPTNRAMQRERQFPVACSAEDPSSLHLGGQQALWVLETPSALIMSPHLGQYWPTFP